MEESQSYGGVSYLPQLQAAEIDELLMGPLGFCIDQLMEMAGLSVASAIAEVCGLSSCNRILIICGPGNNDGYGLVAARHLLHFGYKTHVCYPKRTPKPLYPGLVTQLESLSVPFLPIEILAQEVQNFDVIVDAIFGFSFKGNPRPPFGDLIHSLASLNEQYEERQKSPILVSVDIPSGWHVEDGDITGQGIKPDMLVSLTAPKLCAKKFLGLHHFLGGRFLLPSVMHQFKLQLPPYPRTSMCVRIGKTTRIDIRAPIRPEFREKNVEADPFVQFQKWFDDAVKAALNEPDAMALSTASKDGKPSSRIVSLIKVDKGGFVWCSNYRSRKARELAENPQASLLFYWSVLKSVKVSDDESEQYGCGRPREVHIVRSVSEQSTAVPTPEEVRQRYKEMEEKYSKESMIPRPKHWGGYRLILDTFEYWEGDESSVHMRLRYYTEDVEGRKEWRIVQ